MLLFILASNKQIIHHNFFVYLSRNTNTFISLKIHTFSLLRQELPLNPFIIASGIKSNNCDINQDVTGAAEIEKGMKVACPWAQ